MNMENLLTLKFWFNPRPGLLIPLFARGFVGAILALAALAFVFRLLQARDKKGIYAKIWQSLFKLCLTNAVIGLILLFFIRELIPVLSSRFWLLLWAAETVVWLVFIARAALKIPERKQKLEQEKEYKKYIP